MENNGATRTADNTGCFGRAITWATVLGLLLRLYHYGRNPSMWHDEAATSINVLNKSFTGLFGHLDHSATGPSLLLCLQKCVVLLLGDGTYALRLISFLASCAALLLFVKLAKALLSPASAFCATLLVACSDRLLWHASEARHYSSDFLICVVLLLLFVKTREWVFAKRLGVFALFCPFAVLLSYPGMFLCTGLMLALLMEVREKRSVAAWIGWVVLGTVITTAFAFFYFVTIRNQRSPDMDAAWVNTFPDPGKPWKLPVWAVVSTINIFDYFVRPFAGGILILPAIAGGVRFWKERSHGLVILILVPMACAMGAALVKSYPYAGARTMVYCMPGLALLAAAGLRPLLGWWKTKSPSLAFFLVPAVLFPFAASLVFSFCIVISPWKRADTAGASSYVLAHRQAADPVTSNHWDYEYYFRGIGPAYSEALEVFAKPDAASHPRVWLVLTTATPEERAGLAGKIIAAGWQVSEQHEFENTTVYLLSRAGLK